MEFIDQALARRRARLGEKGERASAVAAVQRREQELREQVDQLIAKIVFPLICKAKRRFEQNGCSAEVDIETAISLDTERSYYRGLKLQLGKGLEQKSQRPVVVGPTLYFAAAPPYSTTIAIVAYGEDNCAAFSERFDIEEMTETVVRDHLKMFVDAVLR